MEYTEMGHLREVIDGEFFLEILVDVIQDTLDSGAYLTMTGS